MVTPFMGVGTQRDSVNWEVLGVELRRENSLVPHLDTVLPLEIPTPHV